MPAAPGSADDPAPRWTARAAAARLIEIARDEGARGVWFKTLGELGYRRLGLFELPLDGGAPAVAGAGGLVMAELAQGDGPELIALQPQLAGGEIDRRRAAGHRGFVARREGSLVGSCWVARGEMWSDYLRRAIPLAHDTACTYETWTLPAARGRGIGPALRAHVAGEVRRVGCRRLLATVYLENQPALRLVEKLGYRRIGTIGSVGPAGRGRGFCRLRRGARAPGEPAAARAGVA
jgi:ribosomal protein S18 acetylase RimI-like enzyme